MALAFSATAAQALDLSALPGDLRTRVEDLLATRFPPEFKSLKLDPAAPVAGQPTKITVAVANNADVTKDETSEAIVVFSKDGGATWDQIALETSDNKVWTGELPAFDAGTTVTYAVRAIDTSGNVFTQLPCKVDAAAVMSADAVAADCVNGSDKCDSLLPKSCMMKISYFDPSYESERDKVPPSFLIKDARLGYDGDNFVLDIAAADKIDKGTVSPMNITIYGAVVVNNSKAPKDSTNVEDLINAGGLMVNAPMAAIAGGAFKTCSFVYNNAGAMAMDESALQCKMIKNHVMFKQKIAAAGENPTKGYQIAFFDGAVTSINPPAGTAYDNTHITNVQIAEENSFTVK